MLLKHYLDRGVSKAELPRRFGVNRRTIHYWIDDRPTGPGSGGRCARLFAASAGGPQAGPLQGDHRRAS